MPRLLCNGSFFNTFSNFQPAEIDFVFSLFFRPSDRADAARIETIFLRRLFGRVHVAIGLGGTCQVL